MGQPIAGSNPALSAIPPGPVFGMRALVARHPCRTRSVREVSSAGRARWGASGALNLQSAQAGLNSLPRSAFSRAPVVVDVEDRVPRSGDA